MYRKWSYILAILLFLPAIQISGQEWIVPDDRSAIPNPSEYDLENVTRGKNLYSRHCQSCHGDPGKNNPLALEPLPVDIASDRMQSNTEGGLFYKISTGRGVMPPFNTTLSDDDRWKLVNFIMNYNPGNTALYIDAPPVNAKLLASIDKEKAIVEILAEYEESSESFKSLANVPVKIGAKRTFGNIEIGQAFTNNNGRAEFVVPESVILTIRTIT